MTRTLALILAALLLLTACAAPSGEAAVQFPAPPDSEPPAADSISAEPLNPCHYYDERLFLQNTAAATPYAGGGDIIAATVPHYAPALGLAAQVLASIAEPPALFIVVGPDHEGLGSGVSLSGRGWATPQGNLSGSSTAAAALLHEPGIRAEERHDLLTGDHSVATLMPYIANYFPEADVVSVLLNKYTDPARLAALAEAIHALSHEMRIFVLCSVDFSHYQSPADAKAADEETMRVIEAGDLPALLRMDGKNLDSPECLYLLASLAGLRDDTLSLLDYETLTYVEDGRTSAASYMIYVV